MTELIRALYDYAYSRRMTCYLDNDTQYHESDIISQRHYGDLQNLLNADGQRRLEDYLGKTRIMHDLEMEAMFQAGLSLGQKLSRL